MQAGRLVTAGGRHHAICRLQPRLWCPLSFRASNWHSHLFEIDLSPLQTPVSTTEKLPRSDTKCASALQPMDAENDIHRLHNEMSKLFGEQVAQYEGDRSLSIAKKAVTVVEKTTQTREDGTELYKEDDANAGETVGTEQSEESPMLDTKTVGADAKLKNEQSFSGEKKKTGRENSSNTLPVNVLLLQGPCSFVRGVWTGGDIGRKELWQRLQALADDLQVVVKSHNYNSEKLVLKKILNTRVDQVIVLCWNISLSKSPFIVHALELIQSNTIIVSPSNVEHGPLPANVVGVLSGFGDQSLSLAMNAAANLVGPMLAKAKKLSKRPTPRVCRALFVTLALASVCSSEGSEHGGLGVIIWRSLSAWNISGQRERAVQRTLVDGKYIGSYSPEARRKRIERFLEKHKRRVWAKKVDYDKEDEELLCQLLSYT
ncbi:unnamed protein product [Peronospora destructor]|uniref:3-dehydroquinate dehydratase n=1 Tax=Peronospora destructor TaxID=86335 RepID=A0AAV0T9Q3_9STRA|nr:unnamed protein product [Peronospora destructor]